MADLPTADVSSLRNFFYKPDAISPANKGKVAIIFISCAFVKAYKGHAISHSTNKGRTSFLYLDFDLDLL